MRAGLMQSLAVHVVDDDVSVRPLLAEMAESGGYRAVTHDSGDAFLAEADLALAGCVVTDVRMPGMSGLEVLREVRLRAPHLPVVVITAHGEVALAVEALKAGAADFLEKPFGAPAFLAVVGAALARRTAAETERRLIES